MKIDDVFNVYGGNSNLTEKNIYANKPLNESTSARIVSSSLLDSTTMGVIDKNAIIERKRIKTFDCPCIIISRNGNAGMASYCNELIAPTDHAYVVTIKEHFKNKINIQWFSLVCNSITLKCISNEDSNATFSKNLFLNQDIPHPLPTITEQNAIVEKYNRLKILEQKISMEINKINEICLLELKLSKYVTLTMSDIANLNKGSSKISEEMIYKNNDSNGIPVYSSATENNGIMGKISTECYEQFPKQGNSNELTWATNGYAGKVFYRDTAYLYSEKCGRIVIKEQYQNKILPQYLCFILNQVTHKYTTAESNNGKLDIINMKKVKVNIPVTNDEKFDIDLQNQIVELYNKLEFIKNTLCNIKNKISLL